MAFFGNEKEAPSSGDPRDRIIEKLAFESLEERRKTRRWSIFFKALMALYVLVFLVSFLVKGSSFGGGGPGDSHTALIDMNGTIAAGGDINSDTVISGLQAAFENEHSRAVIMRINSPGGSAVQSSQIYDEVKRLRALHPEKDVIAVLGDICASGGYFIASAADTIYANPASLVGSIGVIMNGYGFVGTMEKLGVDRRLVTAGENKAMLDPFSPVRESDVTHARTLVKSIHDQFIEAVQKGRGDRIKDEADLFSGLVWTGQQAQERGLIDGFGDLGYVAREIVKETEVVDYTPRPRLLDELASGLGVSMAKMIRVLLPDTPSMELR